MSSLVVIRPFAPALMALLVEGGIDRWNLSYRKKLDLYIWNIAAISQYPHIFHSIFQVCEISFGFVLGMLLLWVNSIYSGKAHKFSISFFQDCEISFGVVRGILHLWVISINSGCTHKFPSHFIYLLIVSNLDLDWGFCSFESVGVNWVVWCSEFYAMQEGPNGEGCCPWREADDAAEGEL